MLRVPRCLVDASYQKRHIHLPSSFINAPSLIHCTSDRAKTSLGSLLQTRSSSCLPGGLTTMTASRSIVPASLFLPASRNDHFETMLQLPRRWRGPGRLRTHLREGTQLSPPNSISKTVLTMIPLQQPDLTYRHPLCRRRATPLRSPRRHPLHLSLLRRHLPRPVPRIQHQTSQPPRRTPRSLLLRARIPLQRRLLPPPPAQQTQKRVGARSDGGRKPHGIDSLPHGLRTDAAERHAGVLHGRAIRAGRAEKAGAAQARVAVGHSVQHHTRECEICVCEYARERLEATGTLPRFDHSQPGHVQEERDDADGDGGWRIAVSRIDRCYIFCLLLRQPGLETKIRDSMQVLRSVRRYG